MLNFIVFYQLAIVSISTLIFVRNLFFSFRNPSMDAGAISIAFLGMAFSFYFLYTNIILLLKDHRNFDRCLKFNAWVNCIQIIQLGVAGITFRVVLGTELAPYIFYSNDAFYFAIRHDSFNLKLNLSFSWRTAGDYVSVGLNIIPALISIYLFKVIDKTVQ